MNTIALKQARKAVARILFFCFTCAFMGEIVAAPEIEPFKANEILTHTKLNDNLKAIIDELEYGANYIPNAGWKTNANGWVANPQFSSGAFKRVPVEGKAGRFALENEPGAAVWVSSDTWFAIDQNKSYRITGTYRALSTSNLTNGGVYLIVRLRDQSNNEIATGDTGWLNATGGDTSQLNNLNQWIHFNSEFGIGTANPFPPAAKFASIAFILNYDSNTSSSGDGIFQVQGLGIYAGSKGPESNWKDLTLIDPVAAFGNEYQVPQFRKIGDQVCLRGTAGNVVKDSNGVGPVLANLPAGYRPPARLIYATAGSVGTGETTTGDRVDILASGDVVAYRVDTVSWLTLDGICFSTTP